MDHNQNVRLMEKVSIAMSISRLARPWFGATIVIGIALLGGRVYTQDVQPVNSGANPYRTIRNWGMLPEERPWGAANGVDIDPDGQSVWVADRCGTREGCVGSQVDPIQKFDESGNLLASFGGGMFVWPHGLHVDQDGNVWVADSRRPTAEELQTFPGEKDKGSVVVKFSPEGEVLMTLGQFGVAGSPPDALTDPIDVVTAPNGDIYVTESHTRGRPRTSSDASRCSTAPGSSSKPSGNWGPGRASSEDPTASCSTRLAA